MLPTKFQFIWSSGFRGEDFFKSANQKQELPVVAMFVNGLGQNEQSLQRTFHGHRCFLPSFSSFGWGVSSHGKSSHCLSQGELKKIDTCVYLLQMQFFSILMHISVIQFRYLYIEITAF
jgi:hypothetical protein